MQISKYYDRSGGLSNESNFLDYKIVLHSIKIMKNYAFKIQMMTTVKFFGFLKIFLWISYEK